MVGDRKIKATWALRLTLPALVLAALGGAAVYLNPHPIPVADADSDLPLVNTSAVNNSAVNISAANSSTTVAAAPAAHSGGCPSVNDFVITITAGSPSCNEITQVATPYTDAILNGEPLGTALMWSGAGWDCTRNYGDSDSMWDANGLICHNGSAAFTLVSN